MAGTHGDVRLSGGGRTAVHLRGDVVVRETGPWTPAVHALLRHLEAVSAVPFSPGGAAGSWPATPSRSEVPSVTGQWVNGSSRWLKSQVFCVLPEHVLLSLVPGQPPLSRWIAQIDRKFMFSCCAKFSIV